MASNSILTVCYLIAGNLPMLFFSALVLILYLALVFLIDRMGYKNYLLTCGIVWALYILLGLWFVGWGSGVQYLFFMLLPLIIIWAELNGTLLLVSAVSLAVVFSAIELYTPSLEPLNSLPDAWQNPIRIIHLLIGLTGVSLLVRRLLINEAGLIKDRARLVEEVQKNEVDDSLTGLLNRKAILNQLDFEITRFERTQDPFVLIMADVDQLKAVNVQYGYPAGDALLKEIAGVFTKELRKQDFCARWGGGDFLFLLPATDLEDGAVVAEKLREDIKNTVFLKPDHAIHQTITFGVSSFKEAGQAMEPLSEAREKMRFGKELGGNRVVWEQNPE